MSDDLQERVARAIAYSGDIREKREWSELLPETRSHYRKQADAALAEMGGVRVKPLVWKKSLGDEHLRSHCEKDGSAYSIIPEVNRLVVRYGPSLIKVCGEWSDAKAAAQADYEARILAAVEPAPVSVREAARVLLDEWQQGEGPLGELCCYSLDEGGTMQPDIDGRWVEFTKIEAALFRAIAEGKD